MLAICHEPRFASLPPAHIVPALADEGRYIASESTFYRVLRCSGDVTRRGRQQARQSKLLSTWQAAAPNQVWSSDITWLKSLTAGYLFYLYLIEDVFSRKMVGYEVHLAKSGDNAAELKSTASHSRPWVSNDNAHVESLFRMLKYMPPWSEKGFSALEEARAWVETFVDWYNEEHRHSGICYVTPGQRHRGEVEHCWRSENQCMQQQNS